MDGQLSFATLDYAGKKKRTKRDAFLAEMVAAVPWSVLEAVIAPHYPKEGPQGGRRAFPIAVMLRIYCLQQWYNLSDPGAEEALYDIQSMRAFCNLELGRDPIPDETTILNFRHLLEAHGDNFQPRPRAVAAHFRDGLFPVLGEIPQQRANDCLGQLVTRAAHSSGRVS